MSKCPNSWVPKCPSSAWVPKVLKCFACPSAQVLFKFASASSAQAAGVESPNSLELPCRALGWYPKPFGVPLEYPWSTLREPLDFAWRALVLVVPICPLKVPRVLLECPMSALRVKKIFLITKLLEIDTFKTFLESICYKSFIVFCCLGSKICKF